MRLSVTFITLNESHQLERSLRSVSWADDIVVVDSGSTDGTPGIVPVDGNGAATGQAEVREAGLVDGAGGPDTSERTSGSITVSDEPATRTLVIRARSGDRDAFELLVRANYDRLYAVARRVHRTTPTSSV